MQLSEEDRVLLENPVNRLLRLLYQCAALGGQRREEVTPREQCKGSQRSRVHRKPRLMP